MLWIRTGRKQDAMPSLLLWRCMSSQSEEGKSAGAGASLANTTLLSTVNINADLAAAYSFQTDQCSCGIPEMRCTLSLFMAQLGITNFGHVGCARSSLQGQRVLDGASKLILASWRQTGANIMDTIHFRGDS